MKTKNRVLSFFLAVLMFASVLHAFPPIEVKAAAPGVQILDPVIGDDYVILKGQIIKNNSLNMQSYGIAYSINGSAYNWEDGWHNGTISNNIPFSVTVDVDPGDIIKYVVWAKDSKGIEGKAYGDVEVPKEEFNISVSELEFPAEGGKQTFYVYASSAYTVGDYQSWISESPTKGSYDQKITVSCEENTTPKDREGTIVVTHNATGEEYEITVYQEAGELDVEFDFSDFEISKEIFLGEDLSWEGKVYIDGGDFDTVTISLKDPDGNSIYYRKTNVDDDVFDTTDILGGWIETGEGTKAPKGHLQDSDGNWYSYSDFAIDQVGRYKLYITASAVGSGEYDKREFYFDVLEPPISDPEIISLTASPTPVRVGEDVTITAVANDSTTAVAFCVDGEYNHIKTVEKSGSSNTFSFTYRFQKTGNPPDSDSNDIRAERVIYAYPVDEDGDIMLDVEPVTFTLKVDPAKYMFDSFSVKASETTVDKAVTITWDAVPSKNGKTVYYNVWVDGEKVADQISANNYTLSVADIKALGVGSYDVMVMATAYEHRQKQSESGLTIYPSGTVIIRPGDVNGDGAITALDATRLRQYLADCEDGIVAYSVSKGSDVNEDGVVNGKDLSKLLKDLKNKGESLPKPDTTPVPTPPVVQHTYTVTFPLDKADLKATTGRTIYIMPKDGFVEFVAYDENGNKASLKQAGYKLEFSKPELFKWGGNTLSALGCGFSYITLKRISDGAEVAQYAVHVGEYKSPVSQWKSKYQYSQEDYEYVSMCLDMMYTSHYANSPGQYLDIWMSGADIVIDSVNSVDEYLLWILQGKTDFEVQIIKGSLSKFIAEYADTIAPKSEVQQKTIDESEFLMETFNAIYTEYDKIKGMYDGVDKIFEIIDKIMKNQANKQHIKNLAVILEKMTVNGELKEFYKSSPSLLAFAAKTQTNYDVLLESVNNFTIFENKTVSDKLLGSIDFSAAIGTGLNILQGIVYVSNDYSNTIDVLEKLKFELSMCCDYDDAEIESINQLIEEYENKYLTALEDLWGKIMVGGINAVASNPIYSIVTFATWVLGEIGHVEEKKQVATMEYYTAALHRVLYAYSNMFTYGQYTITLDDLKFSTATYLNMILWQNQLALGVVGNSSNKPLVEKEIAEIQQLFSEYLVYQVP